MSTYSNTRREQESQDKFKLDSAEREFRRPASKGSAVTEQEKSRAVNGQKVCRKATFTKLALFGEIMAVMSRVNKGKSA